MSAKHVVSVDEVGGIACKVYREEAREGAGARGAEGSEWDWSAERLWKWLEHGVLKVKLGVGARSAFYPWPPPVFHVKMLGRS